MHKHKLYNLTAENFKFPFYVDRKHSVKTISAQNIPMLKWPDGHWCLEANLYMLELYHRGLSRKNRGGTLLAYAANISHLIRFCRNNLIDFKSLSDNEFTFFIKTLQGERRAKSSEMARDANSVIAIGRNCLDFLISVGRFHCQEGFIGPTCRIRASQKEIEIQTETRGKKGKITRKFWHHHSFPTADVKKRRLPISSTNVDKLRNAVLGASTSIFQRKRRYVMIKLLEITGGRRSEVAGLTVDSVKTAAKMSEPMLKLMTAKRPGGKDEFRYIPIARHDVEFLLEFIEKNRRHIVRKSVGLDSDDGYVLISETTGKNLKPNTITQEVHILAKAAGIVEQVCPHLFRHRFIAKLFVALIEQHSIENVDDFRRSLLDSESMKQKIQQWTGHSNVKSLDIYINLAFDEISNFKKTYNLVNAGRVLDSFRGTLAQFKEELKGGISIYDAHLQLSKIIDGLEIDLEILRS